MPKKFSVVIPTLHCAPAALNHLLLVLEQESSVSEVILINNTTSPLVLPTVFSKLRMINPVTNMFVNPSWNEGVRLAKEEYVILLNDDLWISQNVVGRLSRMPLENYGLIGVHGSSFRELVGEPPPFQTELDTISEVTTRTWGYGVMLIFKKTDFTPIPSVLKIWCGDDFLFHKLVEEGRVNGALHTKIYTKMSVTSDLPQFHAQKQEDVNTFRILFGK